MQRIRERSRITAKRLKKRKFGGVDRESLIRIVVREFHA
jgi:hypothetical protein